MSRVLALILILIMAMTGCGKKQPDKPFDTMLDEIFVETLKTDTVALHYYLQHPENYGFGDYEETLGKIDLEPDTWAKDTLAELKKYDRKKLTPGQQLDYDVLEWELQTELMADGLEYYQELAEPTYGIPSNYPIQMAEYAFNEKKDVDHYLELIKDTERYFGDLLKYEQDRAAKGFCMTDSQIDESIKEYTDFVDEAIEKNVLIESFEERLDGLSDLTEEEKAAYIEENTVLVTDKVLPAYHTLMKGLEALKGTNTGNGTLAEYPEGKKYYEFLARNASGSDMSVEDMKALLETRIKEQFGEMIGIMSRNPDVLDAMENPDYGAEEPVDILELIKGRMDQIVPHIDNTQYTVRYVPESLQDSSNPAFCFIPQIDNVSSVIYFNQNPEYANMDFYVTVAHEGYPGHMYQNTYYYGTDPALIRYVLGFGGYTEGWASYISYEALRLSDIADEDVIRLIQLNEFLGYELSCVMDIGVNYEGWTPDELKSYLTQWYGELDDEDVQGQYQMLINSPATYLSYGFGALEFYELRAKAQEALGDQFSETEFHKVILDAGSCPFPILEKQIDAYIASVKK